MFYRHWKKFLLSITALLWASCDDTSLTDSPDLYGCPPDVRPNDIDGMKTDTLYGVLPVYSSSSGEISSSDNCENCNEISSSSEFFGAPIYGDIPVFGDSIDVKCFPTDSTFTYFAEDYSAETKKMWKEEEAKHDAVDKIDSIKQTLTESPRCLENLRRELDRFVALYGAPTIIRNAVEKCIDGTTRPSEEYAKFLKMKEEWEANKPALEEELQKVYEDKMKEIEQRIDKCLNNN